jgi:hypothetical protein
MGRTQADVQVLGDFGGHARVGIAGEKQEVGVVRLHVRTVGVNQMGSVQQGQLLKRR